MKSKFINDYKININDFQPLREINRGGFGIVYEIKSKINNQRYAAKVILTSNSKNAEQMINREIGIMIRVSHPTIIGFHGYSLIDFSGNQNVTYIMDYADRGSLEEILKKVQSGLSPEGYDNTIKQIILIGISYGMMQLHNNRVIHRDLKPGNILIDVEFHPKISDFGLSKIWKLGNSTDQSKVVGSHSYMAPEVLRNEPYDGKADVYSFGIIMYQILTEKIPYPLFESNKMPFYKLHQLVAEDDYRPEFDEKDNTINKSLVELTKKCWSPLARDRPTFEELFHKLAFNQEDSIYGNLTDDNEENENKYYLKDVDYNRVFDYIESLTSENSSNSVLLKKLEEQNQLIKLMQEQINKNQNDIELQSNLIDDLKKLNDDQSKIINDLKAKNENQAKTIKKLSKKYDKQSNIVNELKEENENQSNIVNELKEENENQSNIVNELKEENENQSNIVNELKEENENQIKIISDLQERYLDQNEKLEEQQKAINELNLMVFGKQEAKILYFYFFI